MKKLISAEAFVSSTPKRGLVAFLMVILLAGALSGSYLTGAPGSQIGAPGQAVRGMASDPSREEFYYFKSGQWLADLRTLVAACRYVFTPDSA
jgi:hypothetical protein